MTPSNLTVGLAPDTLKGIQKIAITVAIIGGAGAAAYFIYRAIKKRLDSRDSRKQISDTEDDLKTLIKNGQKLTLTASAQQAIANGLFQAMDGYGTDENAILREFAKINNDADLLAVIKTYGVKTLSSGNFNPVPNFTGTLTEALAQELSSEYVTAINGMLSRKGIKQRL